MGPGRLAIPRRAKRASRIRLGILPFLRGRPPEGCDFLYHRRRMRRAAWAVLGVMVAAAPAAAHPAPFSYVDVALDERALGVTVVAHVFDVAHELSVASPEVALDPGLL